MRTSNPVLNNKSFRNLSRTMTHNKMTIDGTVNKTIFSLLLLVLSGSYFWINIDLFIENGSLIFLMIVSLIIGFILSLITIFKKEWSAFTVPLYAIVEGIFLGLISIIFEKLFPGIVIEAVTLTFGTLFILLLAYKSKLIKVTENFKLGVVAATGGIFIVYLLSFVLNLFGTGIPYIHDNGLIGIGFSLFVVVIASLNLVLDFDFIENAAKNNVPKYMEWYGAFGLLVTLIWLYLEILRLLAKLRSRR